MTLGNGLSVLVLLSLLLIAVGIMLMVFGKIIEHLTDYLNEDGMTEGD